MPQTEYFTFDEIVQMWKNYFAEIECSTGQTTVASMVAAILVLAELTQNKKG
jgi:hypothetical protein